MLIDLAKINLPLVIIYFMFCIFLFLYIKKPPFFYIIEIN